ncbi:MAG: hypothetical protein VR68_12745 [Peptococcaceae bacterium BRH_c4a]|nr:MAG: hypothetical protein VR68_12745 [Peptococcaceae bacterium BRH_c4a]
MRVSALYRLIWAAALIILLPAFGCGDKKAARKPEPPVKIAVSFADMDRDGNKIIKKVMEGRKKRDNAQITWLDAKNDPDRQERQLEKLGSRKIKAVVVQFASPAAGAGLMRKLAEKNIKVVALENLPLDAPADAYVASNHTLSGQLLARFAIRTARKGAGLPVPPDPLDEIGDKEDGNDQGQGGGAIMPPESQVGGKIPMGAVLLSGDPGDAASREIASAARESLQGSAEVRLLAEEAVPQNDPSRVKVILQDILMRNGNNIQAVLATDSRLAMAAVEVLRNAGINNRVLTAGVGADEKSFKALASGEHDAEVDTRPDLLGQFALDAAIGLAKNGSWQYGGQSVSGSYSVPSRITPVRLIQSDNVYLLEQQWGSLKKNGKKEKSQGGGSKEKSGEGSSGGSGEGSGSEEGQEGSKEGGGGGDQGKEGQNKKKDNKTTLRITTQDGKTTEIEINGEIKKIESVGGGKQGGQQEQGGDQSKDGQ